MLKVLDGQLKDWHRVTVERVTSSRCKLTHVSPNDQLQSATSLMLLNHFSQLPVLSKGTGAKSHDVKGMISWRSIAHSQAKGVTPSEVRFHMEKAYSVTLNSTLLEAMDLVSRHDAVLVLDDKTTVTGLVTIEDLNREFVRLTEPFLVFAELEHQLRELTSLVPFSVVQLHCQRDGRELSSNADMDLGDFQFLLSSEAIWAHLRLGDRWDRGHVVRALDQARSTRNDLMHFRPTGVSSARVRRVRDLTVLLRDMTSLSRLRLGADQT